jgi:preprotein translocase subunit SecG
MKALIRGELGGERQFFGDLPAPLHFMGKVLAVLAILFVLGTLALVAILIIMKTLE